MSKPRFLLDTNCFIEPCETFYPFCYAPAFWDALLRGHKAEMVFSLNEVKTEILDDEINNWIKKEDFPNTFFQKITNVAVQKYAEIQNWVLQHPHFSLAEKSKFAERKADGYLVAYAKVHGMTVVTQEKLIIDSNTKKVKIPNICQQYDVEYVNLFEMLKQLKVRFILEENQL